MIHVPRSKNYSHVADDLDLVVDNLRGENLAVENNLEVPRHGLGDRHIVAEIQDLKIF